MVPPRSPLLPAAPRVGQRQHGRAQAVQDGGDLRSSSYQRAHLGGQAGVPLEPAFGPHPSLAHRSPYHLARAPYMTCTGEKYPVRQMLAATESGILLLTGT
jgi:hypothetical protein